MSERGKYWLIEGPGGSGKSTLLHKLARFLGDEFGRRVEVVREPGGEQGPEQIRDFIFVAKAAGVIDAGQQAALFNAARYILMGTKVEPLLITGVDVASDRGAPSTVAFQGAEGGDAEKLDRICEFGMRGVKPDVVLFLDVSAETVMSRRSFNHNGDPYDRLGRRFVERVVANYRELWKVGWGGLNWQRIDAECSMGEVEEVMKTIVSSLLGSGVK